MDPKEQSSSQGTASEQGEAHAQYRTRVQRAQNLVVGLEDEMAARKEDMKLGQKALDLARAALRDAIDDVAEQQALPFEP